MKSNHRCPAFLRLSQSLSLAALLAGNAGLASAAAVLEEVVVTAERREENLQETPIAVTAFNEQTLLDLGIHDLKGVGDFVPNVRVVALNSTAVSAAATIRGLASAEPSLAQDPKVGFYLDGVYLSKNTGSVFDVVDLERVEVLRGPQGTLYGKNTTGGAINLISKKPSGELGFKQQLTGGDRGRFRSSSVLDLPAWQGLSAKLGYVVIQHDGFIENTGSSRPQRLGEVDNEAWRLALRWQPGDDFTADFSYQQASTKAAPQAGQLTAVESSYLDLPVVTSFSPFTVVPPADNPFRQALASGAVSEDRLGQLALDNQGYERYDIVDAALHLSWQLGAVELRSITGYHDLDGDLIGNDQDGGTWSVPFGHFALPQYQGNRKAHTAWSQELQLIASSADERWQSVSGLYYFAEEAEELHNRWDLLIYLPGGALPGFDGGVLVNQNALLGPPPTGLGEEYSVDNTSWAAYSQVTWTPPVLDDRLGLTLGLRYTEDEKEAVILDATPHWEQSASWSNWNPTATVTYRFSDDINGYAKVATGYNAGSHPVRAGNEEAFALTADEENLIDYEVGLKSEWLQRRLRVNVAAFLYDYDDLQVNDFVSGATVLLNAGQATIQGLELESTLQVSDALVLGLDYGYLTFDYDEFVVGGQDIADSARAPFAPEHTAHAWAQWRLPFSGPGALRLRLDATYTDEYIFSPTLYRNGTADERTLVDARLSWSDIPLAGGALALAVWGRNVTNEAYREFGTDFGTLGFTTNVYGDLATWGVDLIFEY
ncbi:TonB-dependent receptor [Parahaliea mediterranea]|uniref:TonB-dependent receptor n=1 Tax=Parahaliea mediterranea TaxID=651086 RepID=UPI000E2E4701|nr:TonB-dependent receptor [Parahaliea mediterranea]